MLYSLFTKRLLSSALLFPLDFYRFNHTEEHINHPGQRTIVKRPLWIVGVSPFDNEIVEDEGHVVHLGNPGFTARWTMNEEKFSLIESPNYVDEDLNMIIHEVIPLGGSEMPEEVWLLEAVCAIGYSRGLITMSSPEELH